jgi:hypothetical protein
VARGPKHRRLEERIFDIVRSARALNFKIVVGNPIIADDDIQRIEPPVRTGGHEKLLFYIGKKAWSNFIEAYFIKEDSPVLAGIEVEFYKPPDREPGDGTS